MVLNLKKIFYRDSLNNGLNSTLYNGDKDCSYYSQRKDDIEKNFQNDFEDEEKIKLNDPKGF